MVRKTVTLVFCDVADSTPLGEQLDPEALRGVWSRYHETARAVLERHGGTIEKFVGDAVLGVFGIPVVHEDDAVRAVRAAVELRDELAALNSELERVYGVRIGVRTGVHTGEVFAGDPAQGDPFATGDAVVVAQRLEAAATAGEILVGDATIRLVRDAVTAEPVPSLTLKGKSYAVAAWRLLDVDPAAAGVARRLDSPLVGRTAELTLLRHELELVQAARSCRVVTILGEPGVGKSRLAAELVASGGGEVLALEGKCLPYGNGITYWPLVEMVRGLDLEEILAGEPDAELVGDRILEAIGRGKPRSRSDELYWAVRRLLETLALERPVVVVVDDTQWAEPALLDLIEYLVGWSRDAPILIVCLARPDLVEIRRAGMGATIQLVPLGRDDARVLLEQLAGPIDAAAADAVSRATGGNPLFLEETLRMLVEDGLLVERDGALRPLTEIDTLRVPGTVQAVLAARLDLLEPNELAVLQRAAVMGQMFLWGAVAELTPPDQTHEVAGHLQALVRKQLIRPDRRTFEGEDGFRFGHILIRDAAYDSMSKRLRGELHERFAEWVEVRAADRTDLDEILGHHLEQAYFLRIELSLDDDKAAALASRARERLARAGRRALAREDPHAAASLLGRTIALPGDDTESATLRLDHASATYRAGNVAAAAELFERLLAESPASGVAASARLEQAVLRSAHGHGSLDELLQAAEQAADTFAELDDHVGLAQAWNTVAQQLFWRGLTAQLADAAQRALEYAREASDSRYEASALNALAIALVYGPTPAGEASERCRALLARAEELGTHALPLFVLAGAEAMCGRIDNAWEFYDRGTDRDVVGVRAGVSLYAQPLFELEPKRAVDELRQTLLRLEEQGVTAGRPTAVVMLAEALVALGKPNEAADVVAKIEIRGVEDVSTKVLRLRVEGRIRGGRSGRAGLRRAVALAREQESPHLLAGTLVALAELERGDARRAALREAAALYRLKGHVRGGVREGLDLIAPTR